MLCKERCITCIRDFNKKKEKFSTKKTKFFVYGTFFESKQKYNTEILVIIKYSIRWKIQSELNEQRKK